MIFAFIECRPFPESFRPTLKSRITVHVMGFLLFNSAAKYLSVTIEIKAIAHFFLLSTCL